MTRIRRGRGAAFLAGTLAAFGLAAQPGVSQDEQPKKAATAPPPPRLDGDPAPKSPGNRVAGVQLCIGCHRGGLLDDGTKDTTPGQAGLGENFISKNKSDKFVLMTESGTWQKADIHSVALRNLDPAVNPIAKRMQDGYHQAYGKDHPEWKDIRRAKACLTCHSVDLNPAKPLAEKNTETDFIPQTGPNQGVNCTACHGLGNKWQNEHFTPDDADNIPWRTYSPQQKYDSGMADLRNPAVRGRLCATCHVGSAAEGKVVTHEMYAVGHPPLPPIELAAFQENEPKHWAYPTDSRLSFFKEFADKNAAKTWDTFRFHPADKETYLARTIAAGAIAALEAEAQLLASADPSAQGGLDFARFDCYACHHDLRYPSYRQDRGYENAPGRPTVKAWSGVLPTIIAEHATGLDNPKLKALGAEFKGKWEAVRKAAADTPFGNATQLKKDASDLAAWCNSFLRAQTEVNTPVYTPDQSRRLAAMLRAAAADPKRSSDPESAMVLTWAYTTLRADMKNPVPAAELAALDETVSVRIREPKFYTDSKTNKPPVLNTYLAERMSKFNAFDPARFRSLFPKPMP